MGMGFVVGVFWYSVKAVGKSEVSGVDGLVEEASYAKKKSAAEEEVEELLQMDNITEDLEIALAADADLAEEEEKRLRTKGNAYMEAGEKSSRAMWRRIVFFWRR